MVRQFLDTRRSHIAVLVDGDLAAYPDAEHFETALSAGASVAVRAIRDDMDTTVFAGDQVSNQGVGPLVLDSFARAEQTQKPLRTLAARAASNTPDASVALIITGSVPTMAELVRAANYFPIEVNTIALRIDPRTRVGIASVGSLTVLNLTQLSDLPMLLVGATVE
jgi:hypothetical protein